MYAMTSLNPEALRGNAPPVEEAIPPREAAAGREIVEAAVRAALEILDEFPGTPHGEIVNAIGDELEFGLDPTDDYDAFIAEVFNRIRED